MSGNLWSEFETFWDRNEIEKKGERYQELYENPDKTDDTFTWVNEKDKLNKESKAANWGIPNHILGDIDNAKFIVGLFNPGTHMTAEQSEQCSTVGEYIQKEIEIEKNTVYGVEFESKEIFEENANHNIKLHNFYFDHILSKENVISQELKKLYKIFKENKNEFNLYLKNGKLERFNSVAYYLGQYYAHVFEGSESAYVEGMNHYQTIFEKMNEAEQYVSDIDQAFDKALSQMKITNIELLPYRTSTVGDIGFSKKYKSSQLSAKIIIEKLLADRDAVVILRSRAKWEGLFIDVCESKNIDYSLEIEPRLFELGTSGAISKNNVYPVKDKKNNSNFKTEHLLSSQKEEIKNIVDQLREEISLKDFEAYLDDIISKNNN
ncbi:hypothetical protein [Staphylococcus warneri]|uniref:hypothetical protein n=1 Tax=Staphylococcus warneri TaxID=1292 RepID=UPI0001A5CC28|nr:hypothetical protein [Staphylococcus warneri]EEQ80971.1 hypothetical protein STAWA0001_0271 [Staphylococcus warneri L37603]MBO0376668.1 hypothetical protein [Staphylococcus warneri]MCJ1804579.1 hypothetical protein [Staphylococcus warneri]MDU9351976.1 hypothetical protein [Staphylococcus warneri]QKI07849.1 hypothetical protein FOC62_09595 [Staphylococcus warneri]